MDMRSFVTLRLLSLMHKYSTVDFSSGQAAVAVEPSASSERPNVLKYWKAGEREIICRVEPTGMQNSQHVPQKHPGQRKNITRNPCEAPREAQSWQNKHPGGMF